MRDLQAQVDALISKLDVARVTIEGTERRNRELVRAEKTLQQRLQRHEQLLLQRESEILEYKMKIKLLEDAETNYKKEIQILRSERFENVVMTSDMS